MRKALVILALGTLVAGCAEGVRNAQTRTLTSDERAAFETAVKECKADRLFRLAGGIFYGQAPWQVTEARQCMAAHGWDQQSDSTWKRVNP